MSPACCARMCSLSLCGWICADNGARFRAQSLLAIGPGRANPNTCRRPPGNVTSRHVMSRRAGERTPEPVPAGSVTRPEGNRSNRRPRKSKYIKDSRVAIFHLLHKISFTKFRILLFFFVRQCRGNND